MTTKIGRSLTYIATLLLGGLLGSLFTRSGNAPPPSPGYRSLVQSSGAPLLGSSSNDEPSKRRSEDDANQNDSDNLNVPTITLKRALRNMGMSGIDINGGSMAIDSSLVEILEITDVEIAKLKEPFSAVLTRVRESQVQAAEVVSHDPEGESVIRVGAASEEQAQRWQEEIHAASLGVLGKKRGGIFNEIIGEVLLHSLAYSAMTITASRSSTSDVSEEHFQFVIASENGTSTYGSTSVPQEIAHLIDLTESSER